MQLQERRRQVPHPSTISFSVSLVDRLIGRTPFKGVSPVDVICGLWDMQL